MRATLTIVGAVRPLTPPADLTLYRTTQEALTNVGKHAKTSHVDLTLHYGTAGSVRLRVQDNGMGSADSQGGFGLLGVQERVQLLGGEVLVRTEVGKGFTLEVELPE